MAPTPWAILLCRFQDNLTEPQPRDFYEDLFTASGRGENNLVDFFDDFSLGHADLGGSQVFGWFTLAQTRAQYTGSGLNPQGRWDLIGWARTAAAAGGVNLAPFFGVVVCMNVSTDLWGGGGAVCCDPGSMQVSILAQEIGHGFGLDHSRVQGSDTDYQDRWDVMSTWSSCFMATHPRWTLIGPGLNAANMHGRGWLDASRTCEMTPKPPPKWKSSSGRDVELRPLHRRDLPGFLAARVRFGSVELFFELRVRDRWDAAIPRPAVLAHEFAYNHSYLVPADSGSHDLGLGDAVTVYPSGDLTKLRVEVAEIDANQQRARLMVQVTRPRRRLIQKKPKRPKPPPKARPKPKKPGPTGAASKRRRAAPRR